MVVATFPEHAALFALAFLGLPCLPDGVTFSIQAPAAGHERVAQLNQVHAACTLAGRLLARWPELGKTHWICAAPTSMPHERRAWLGATVASTVAKSLVDAANVAAVVAAVVATNASISPAARSVLLQQVVRGIQRVEERQASQSPPLPAPGLDQLELDPPGDLLSGVLVPRLRRTPASSPPAPPPRTARPPPPPPPPRPAPPRLTRRPRPRSAQLLCTSARLPPTNLSCLASRSTTTPRWTPASAVQPGSQPQVEEAWQRRARVQGAAARAPRPRPSRPHVGE